jgi:hypothetical protein
VGIRERLDLLGNNTIEILSKLNFKRMNHSKPILLNALGVIFLALSMITGCKKESNNPAPSCTNGVKDGDETGIDCGGSCPVCVVVGTARIKTHYHAGRFSMVTDTYNYDSQGRLTSISSSDGSVESFSYSGNIITHVNFGYTWTYKLNAQGYIDSVAGQSGIFTESRTYDASGHQLTEDGSGYNYTYSWSDDNMTTTDEAGTNTTYTYLTAPNSIGNANSGRSFFGKDSKNLQATRNAGVNITYSYAYDSQNRVIGISGEGDENFTYF